MSLLILPLVSCKQVSENKNCMSLTVSKSLPLEWVPVGTDTYNERVSGLQIEKYDFHQEFRCNDEIKTRMLGLVTGDIEHYKLSLLNSLGIETLLDFVEASTIVKAILGTLSSAINDANTSTAPEVDWALGANPNVTVPFNSISSFLKTALSSGIAGLDLNFIISYDILSLSGATPVTTPRYYVFSADMTQFVEVLGTDQTTVGTFSDVFTMTPSFTPAWFIIAMVPTGGSDVIIEVQMNSQSITSQYYNRTVYENLFIPSVISLCESCLKASIKHITLGDEISLDPTFINVPSSTWYDGSDIHLPDWSAPGPGEVHVHLAPSGQISDNKIEDLPSTNLAGQYTVKIKVVVTTADTTHFTVSLGDPDNLYTDCIFTLPGAGTYELFLVVDALYDFSKIFFHTSSSGTLAKDITAYYVHVYPSIYEEAYRTDYFKVGENIDENTQLIYTSTKDFDGIPYEGIDGYFAIRVQSLFFFGDDPMVSKVLDLSNSTIIETGSSLKKRRKFTLDDMPEYMRDKIKRVLMHGVKGSVLIENVNWIIDSDFSDVGSRPDSYPMKATEVWLTKKTGYIQNII